MNKNTYMATLKRELRGLPYDEIKEIVEEFDEHFDEAHSRGLDDATVVEKLGSAEQVAFAYRLETSSPLESQPFMQAFKNLSLFIGMGFTGLVGIPLVFSAALLVASLYAVVILLYLTAGLLVLTPILSLVFPDSVHTGGVSLLVIGLIGVACFYVLHYVIKYVNKAIVIIFKKALKKAM